MTKHLAYPTPGASLSLQLESHGAVNVPILRALPLQPISYAQRYVIPAHTIDGSLPSLALLKVFDTMFFAHRAPTRLKHEQAWSLENELAAQQRRAAGLAERLTWENRPEKDDMVGWEEFFLQEAEESYLLELEAYRRLEPLNGAGVLHFYDCGHLILDGRAITPRVLLLEHLPDAVSLPHVNRRLVSYGLMVGLVELMMTFQSLGIVHTNLSPEYVVFSPADCPTRAVLDNFEEVISEDDVLEVEPWEHTFAGFHNLSWMSRTL